MYLHSDRRALTDSELEDLEAEAEAEAEYHEEDEYEEEGVEQLTLEEYEAKKAAEKKSILPALPPERKAGEGVVMKGGQRDAHEDLEVLYLELSISLRLACSFLSTKRR